MRRYSKGRRLYYYVSDAGMITPNLPAGQAWIKENARFIGENGEPLPPIESGDKFVNDVPPKKSGFLSSLLTD